MTKNKVEFQPLQIGEDDFDEFIDEFDTQLEEDNDDEERNESRLNFNMTQISNHHYVRNRFIAVVVIVVGTVLAVYVLLPASTSTAASAAPKNSNNIHINNDSDISIQQTKAPSPKYSVQLSDGQMYELVDIQNTHQNSQDLKLNHDKSRFTQGLTYSKHSNTLFESFGLYGKSGLCQLDPITGNSTKCVTMDSKYFAEGMQVYMDKDGKERLIQITWKEKIGFIYDAKTLEQLESFEFQTAKNEGWGICLDRRTMNL